VIIAIGANEGVNIMSTALFKNLGAKKLISRAISPLHENVLQAIGVDEIMHPEQEAAERWAKRLCLNDVVDSFELDQAYSIVEANVPEKYVGQTIEQVQFREKYNVLILTTIQKKRVKGLLGKKRVVSQAQGVVRPDQELAADDILVLYGANDDLSRLLKRRVSI
ncbi:MAG: NAD-binding protein, partial [Bacteroidota bacterium]